jgi:hypothetical protein
MQRAPFVRVLLASLVPAAMAAQAPNPSAMAARSREALAPVARIVGQWEGEARVSEGPGEPIRVLQSEDIVWGAGGTMIFIRGTGRDPSTRAINFEAAASIWFDPESGRVRMRTHRDGGSVEPTVEIKPDTIVWSFPVRGGTVRYVIALTDSTWHEEGFFEREGAPPFKMIDMRLRRVPR